MGRTTRYDAADLFDDEDVSDFMEEFDTEDHDFDEPEDQWLDGSFEE